MLTRDLCTTPIASMDWSGNWAASGRLLSASAVAWAESG